MTASQWFTKKEIISKLIADGCRLKPHYLTIRLSQINDILQFNKHYIYDDKRCILYSDKAYDIIKHKFIKEVKDEKNDF